ncbi:hypothetical protein AURDEDRAFT_168943 [Auricularia subglabra TFB-10046 SS5]|nr:hypothetical protein AURDEDRAFT_168943 [Auricularia subglabra TFB-10046 SS5]
MIQRSINVTIDAAKTFIRNPKGEGINPETIAFVLAASHVQLYNCVKEWETGTREAIKFRDDTFRNDYVVLLDGLRVYEKGNPALFLKLRRKLYKAGIAHAGVIANASAHSGPSAADFARAAALDTISDSDDDGNALVGGAAPQEPAAEDAEDTPFTGVDEDDLTAPRARRRARATLEDEDNDRQAAAGGTPEPVEMTPADREAYFGMLMEEREVYLWMQPDDREIFLEMSPGEREQWMNDCDADEDGDDDTSGNTAGHLVLQLGGRDGRKRGKPLRDQEGRTREESSRREAELQKREPRTTSPTLRESATKSPEPLSPASRTESSGLSVVRVSAERLGDADANA